MQTYRAADLLVDTLIQQDIRRVFCVPGESYLSVLDAFTNQSTIEVVTARHEGGAGFMAVTEAKMGPRPGICFVSRGPGAMNAAIALHTAQDRKSTRLNSSHVAISYAVFCLKKKKSTNSRASPSK